MPATVTPSAEPEVVSCPQPPAGKRRVILADIHGNYPTMLELLEKTGAIDAEGRKNPDVWVCQVGDLLHLGHEVFEADVETLKLGLDLIDCFLIGNHEAPYITSFSGIRFQGLHLSRELSDELFALLGDAIDAGHFQAAASVDGWLITHAGLHPGFTEQAQKDGWHRQGELIPADVASDSVKLASYINERFTRTKDVPGSKDPLFTAISGLRGGREPFGGILWCDWDEISNASHISGFAVPQIHGHSPRPAKEPICVKGKLWNIDLAGIDAGYCSALVKDPGESEWTPVIVQRHKRPGT